MPIITYAFRYARPVSVNTREIRHEDGHIEFTSWKDSQMDELVRDLNETYKRLSDDYRLFYSRGYDKNEQSLGFDEFRSFDYFIKWLSSLDVNHDAERNRGINLELNLPIRRFLYESMHGGSGNNNSRVVRLKPIIPIAQSNETKYDMNGCPEADFYEAWPLESWLTDGLGRSNGLKDNMKKLEEMIRSSL